MMDDIKVFVSHRIDYDSTVPLVPELIPVRCGAIYDRSKNADLQGDDTGENISNKRFSYCELTVLYWAWKNTKADYYGLCHYRRYFNWSSNEYVPDGYGNVLDTRITPEALAKYGIDSESIHRVVSDCDMVVAKAQDVTKYPGGYLSVWDQYSKAEHLHEKDLELLLKVIEDIHPEDLQTAKEYLLGTTAYVCNLFVMKGELFHQYCPWLFSILNEFEKRADTKYYSAEGYRTTAHIGERLLGVFVLKMRKERPDIRITELQPVVFLDTKQRIDVDNMLARKENDMRRGMIRPAFEAHNVAIALSCSDEYVPYAAALIRSIADFSSQQYNYDLLLIHKNICNENQLRLQAMDLPANMKLRLIDMNDYDFAVKMDVNGYFSIETYFRLFLPFILFAYDKIVWLDSDTIVQRDIAELYRIEMGNALIAGTRDYNVIAQINGFDPKYRSLCINELHMDDPYQYFQAGVLVINLSGFRNNFTLKQIIQEVERGHYPYCDQEILNKLCYGRVHWLDNKWDVPADINECLSSLLSYWGPHDMYENYKAIKDSPYIIHYAGPTKPWHNPRNKLADRFWDCCRRTGFYEMALVQMLADMSQGIERYGMEPKPKAAGESEIKLAQPQSAGIDKKGNILKRAVRCIKENGLRYTWMRIITKLRA